MAVNVHIPLAYDELIAYLSQFATPQQVLDFEVSGAAQERAELLLEKVDDGTITFDEQSELEQMLYFDRLVSELKAKALDTMSK